MERRGFFGRVLGGIVAVKLGPQMGTNMQPPAVPIARLPVPAPGAPEMSFSGPITVTFMSGLTFVPFQREAMFFSPSGTTAPVSRLDSGRGYLETRAARPDSVCPECGLTWLDGRACQHRIEPQDRPFVIEPRTTASE